MHFYCKVSHAWLWLPSLKGLAGVHAMLTEQEYRAWQVNNTEAAVRCGAYRVAPIPITETAV